MKIARTYTIDIELAERLRKQGNASETVNRLLEDYFSEGGKMSRANIQTEIVEKKAAMEKIRIDITKLEEKLAKTPKANFIIT